MPSTSTPTSRTPTLPHKFTPGASHEQGYFASQTTPSTTIAVTTPFPLASSPGNTSPSTYYTPGGFPAQPEMLASLSRLPPPPRLSLPIARYPSSEPSSPRVMTFHRAPSSSEVPSPMDRPRRSPPPMQSPNMTVSSILAKHTLHVQLPISIQPEMITISAQKGDKLKVVADAWHMESDCHYEWQISFPPYDIDMSAIQARVEPNGHLYIDVRRLTAPSSTSFRH